ncbi:glycosyltransferase [Robertkochia aurantiaca]|uniref:glycosyltransferase n=1 Tax=Robertkochia aurantiaca TaxID=2873700 RepID=UPI001CCF9427|nr:glycosyltransferase [Robertkochia sp. 3YJGBD-33]
MKKALVHDWFTVYGGAERCVESFINLWEDFDVFSLVDDLNESDRKTILKGKKVQTSFIQNLPFGKKRYRNYLPLFPLAIEQLDLRDYELIISSSSSVAKGVLTNHNQLHIVYMYSPVRYAWDLHFQYLKESGLESGFKGFLAKYFLHKLRVWDLITANRPDYYIAISNYIAKRIKKTYNKEAFVIYPPVDTSNFNISEVTKNYYITCSRMVPYKKIDLIVRALSGTDRQLIVIGDGPEYDKIKRIASENVQLLGFVEKDQMLKLLKESRAFIFAAEEDFGIAPVEAQACGVPVIAYGAGGALETINGFYPQQNIEVERYSGVFFKEQTEESLIESLNCFEQVESRFDKNVIRDNALRFRTERFESEFKELIDKLYRNWKLEQN